MKKILIMLIIFFGFYLGFGEKIGELTEVLKPENISIGNNQLYIMEGATIYIYSLSDTKLIRKFGQKGEGPGELQVLPFLANTITIIDNNLFVQSLNKVLFFKSDGTFVKETKKLPTFFRILPLGDNYVGNKLINDQDNQQQISSFGIFDGSFKETVKEFLQQEVSTRGANLFMAADTIQFDVYMDKIYVEDSKKGFIVEVFDPKGNKIKTIKKDYPPLPLTDEDKTYLIEDLKQDTLAASQIKQAGGWENFKKFLNLHWPKNFPSIRDIIVSSDLIYIQTYKRKDNKMEFIVLKQDGTEVKKAFLPKVKEPSLVGRLLGRGTRFFDIKNGKFYYIVENEDEEVWELHSVNI